MGPSGPYMGDAMSVEIIKENPALKAPELKDKKLAGKTYKEKLKYLRDRDSEKVKGIFKFYECAGARLEFVYRAYDEELQKYELIDGHVYELPIGVAKHLNKSGSYPVHAFTQDETGKPVEKIGQKVRRYGFQSLEFIDVGEFDSPEKSLVTVEYIR